MHQSPLSLPLIGQRFVVSCGKVSLTLVEIVKLATLLQQVTIVQGIKLTDRTKVRRCYIFIADQLNTDTMYCRSTKFRLRISEIANSQNLIALGISMCMNFFQFVKFFCVQMLYVLQ